MLLLIDDTEWVNVLLFSEWILNQWITKPLANQLCEYPGSRHDKQTLCGVDMEAEPCIWPVPGDHAALLQSHTANQLGAHQGFGLIWVRNQAAHTIRPASGGWVCGPRLLAWLSRGWADSKSRLTAPPPLYTPPLCPFVLLSHHGGVSELSGDMCYLLEVPDHGMGVFWCVHQCSWCGHTADEGVCLNTTGNGDVGPKLLAFFVLFDIQSSYRKSKKNVVVRKEHHLQPVEVFRALRVLGCSFQNPSWRGDRPPPGLSPPVNTALIGPGNFPQPPGGGSSLSLCQVAHGPNGRLNFSEEVTMLTLHFGLACQINTAKLGCLYLMCLLY